MRNSGPTRKLPIRVLAWPAFANRVENPYNALLYTSLRELGVEVEEFSVQRLLFGPQADVLHLHWAPTTRIRGNSRARVKRTSAQMLWLLEAAKRRGMKVVWTAHNIGSHDKQDYPDLEKNYWPAVARHLGALISLSKSGVDALRDKYPSLATVPSFVSRHGSYRGAYPRSMTRENARSILGISDDARVLAFVGQVRPYKNVPALLRAFGDIEDRGATLLIAGQLKLGDKRPEFDQLVRDDDRVMLFGSFVHPVEMQIYLEAADLVVLPYRETLNSGSAILGLSFDRPVLVPASGPFKELADDVGHDWLMTYTGELTPAVLSEAIDRSIEKRGEIAPLESLEWPLIARQTRDIYRSLVER